MALNLQTNRVDDNRSLQDSLRAVERHLDDDHYIRGFMPGEFVLVGSAYATLTGASARWSTVAFPDAAPTSAYITWRKPTEWRGGRLKFKFWYTSDVGSTNNFVIVIAIDAIREGEVLVGTDLYVASATYAGPAVANTVMTSGLVYSTGSLGSDDELFSFKIFRDGTNASDNNVNDFHLLYLTVEHIPAFNVSQ